MMSAFSYTENLSDQSVRQDVAPWEFELVETLTEQVRKDKQSRQDFYHNKNTKHYFYTLFEGTNPNMRPSKENPPRYMHGFVTDYDCKLTEQRIDEVIAALRFKPAWVERSLGGNARLIWLFEKPLLVDSYDFAMFLLDRAIKWLELGQLPALDEPAFKDPSRLMCNGCNWRATGFGTMPQADVQAFYVSCGKDFKFKPISTVADVPLDVVEAAIREKFPAFEWPCEFVLNSQGPSFFIANSVSAQSAVVHPGGMFTFSAHAPKPFFSWGDILGPDFISKYTTKSISSATEGVYYDGMTFWLMCEAGYYRPLSRTDIIYHFRVDCRVSAKPDKGGTSPIDQLMAHFASGKGRIDGAAPFVFRAPGIIFSGEKKMLNIYSGRVMKAAEGKTEFGPNGKAPFISSLVWHLFPEPIARMSFLAWWKLFYESGMNLCPHPGQNVYLLGIAGKGKTVLGRLGVGGSVGGFCDGSEYLTGTGAFNSQMLEVPLWCVDDETLGDSSVAQARFAAMAKKSAANQEHMYSKKYQVPCMVGWEGRIFATMNLDHISSRTIGTMDNSSLDKTHLFLCGNDGSFIFPEREAVKRLFAEELPWWIRLLRDLEVPDIIERDPRYGYKSFHHEALLDRAAQSGKFAPFKELLIEAFRAYFIENPEAKEWKGAETQILRLVQGMPGNSEISRSLRLEQTSRYLEMIMNEGLIKCSISTGEYKTKIWTFQRFENCERKLQLPERPIESVGQTTFQKP